MLDAAVLAALIGGGFMTGITLMNKFLPNMGGGGDGGMPGGGQSPNFGQTLMSQRPMPTVNDIFPKPQPRQQNGSILGNSLYNNPFVMRTGRGGVYV